MKPFRRILVAVKDTAAESYPAIDKAAQIARAFGGTLELFHTISDSVYVDFELTNRSLKELEQQRIDAHLGRLQVLASKVIETGVRTTCHVDWDFPAHEAIVRRAMAIKADLIVAQCHEGLRVAPWLLHLTDWELLRASATPVLLVRTIFPYERPTVLAAVDPGHAHAKSAKLDEAILDTGKTLARRLDGALHALHACFPVPLDVDVSKMLSSAQAEQLYDQITARARARFTKVAVAAKVPRALRHLVSENPVIAIPQLAKEIGADIVVMGAVSRSGLKRVFIGNTAERVLGALPCDVLVVKPRHFAARVPRKMRGARFVSPHLPLP